ncbi:FAD-binding protein [Ancylobacter sp. MQZ15Z-1]|uniref:FAD-binding protein n=1 Tax=Ancylobacter mangrovi TaxID=2972472 RepID=A0A9X2T5H8_9HYPH|nr:FAD-binding protein [Ancylobacter mangrovi]MCS0497301.1 FAD-binding protein [Ancylobacter mangrovi]
MSAEAGETLHFDTDVLVVGGGGAGMYAALSAAADGARVILLDKNVVGRGGATIMAQMTCASALGEAEPDGPQAHLADTLEAGRGLCDETLAGIVCEGSPTRIRELGAWRVNWARDEEGRIAQVLAPGHSRRRCVYVDFLSTGTAISAALRRETGRNAAVRRLSNVTVTDLVVSDGEVTGAVGFDIAGGASVTIRAGATVLCLGGMAKLYRRTTAPANSAGEGLGLALRAGARLVDIEFLQFYPNGHLAPRMVGLDPTTWEPTRVKLGGRLLNSEGEEFLARYGEGGEGYNTTRDLLTHAIYREVAEGRGTPNGGVYLSFQHIAPERLKAALGPFIDIFASNNIDISKQPVEIFPIAHYQMGGIVVTPDLATDVPGLYAAGEIVGGANGANRLSGNALPEALVFGERAGRSAAAHARARTGTAWDEKAAAPHLARLRERRAARPGGPPPVALLGELRSLMWEKVGAFRNEADLEAALRRIRQMQADDLPALSVGDHKVHNTDLVEWFELRGGLVAAEALTLAALRRRESRGAHQRDDFPDTDPALTRNQFLRLDGGALVSSFGAAP